MILSRRHCGTSNWNKRINTYPKNSLTFETRTNREGDHGNEAPTKFRDNVSPSKQKIVVRSKS